MGFRNIRVVRKELEQDAEKIGSGAEVIRTGTEENRK
jgi:hypothetical protein